VTREQNADPAQGQRCFRGRVSTRSRLLTTRESEKYHRLSTMTPRELYDSLDAERIAAMILARRAEDLHLDFKNASSPMERDDRKSLATSISGYANAEGGVIVWGVDARRTRGTYTVESRPIRSLASFLMELQENTGNAADPPVAGVVHKPIDLGGDSGYCATLVPVSDAGPHEAKHGEDRFYLRSGDQFRRMERYEIAERLGRRARPSLILVHEVSTGARMMGRGSSRTTLVVRISILNNGRMTVAAPYIEASVTVPWQIFPAGVAGVRGSDFPMRMPEDTGALSRRLVGESGFVIHPKTRFPVLEARNLVEQGSTPRTLEMRFSLAATDLPLIEGELTVHYSELMAALRRT
jgi:Putative DNA-binding domain